MCLLLTYISVGAIGCGRLFIDELLQREQRDALKVNELPRILHDVVLAGSSTHE